MTELKPYRDIKVNLLWATPNPQRVVERALSMTQKQDFEQARFKNLEKVIATVVKQNHGSIWEHIVYGFEIEGASRSFLAQQTRHRMASYTSGSQHYQDYRNYGMRVSDSIFDNPELKAKAQVSLDASMKAYVDLIDAGVDKSESRQLLPNAAENNLLVTTNARSLMNYFNLRLCKRNTEEIQVVARKMYDLALEHFPELWKNVGPDCYQNGSCNQGKMSCGKVWTP